MSDNPEKIKFSYILLENIIECNHSARGALEPETRRRIDSSEEILPDAHSMTAYKEFFQGTYAEICETQAQTLGVFSKILKGNAQIMHFCCIKWTFSKVYLFDLLKLSILEDDAFYENQDLRVEQKNIIQNCFDSFRYSAPFFKTGSR